jgi:hypothetical protein
MYLFQFATDPHRRSCWVIWDGQTTNLGVRTSNLFGRANKTSDYRRLISVNFAKVGEVIAVMHAKPYFGGSTSGSSCLAMSPAPESEM